MNDKFKDVGARIREARKVQKLSQADLAERLQISTSHMSDIENTIEIIALVSGSRETPVWCMIYDDLEYEREADIFANQMKYAKALSPYEIFMANIEAGNDKQLIIKSIRLIYTLLLFFPNPFNNAFPTHLFKLILWNRICNST